MAGPFVGTPPPENVPEERLDSWKEIAAYLNRDVTTVQRWEKREGMPVHRHLHDKRGSVYAIGKELDAWRKSRGADGEKEAEEPSVETAEAQVDAGAPRRTRAMGYWLAGGVAAIGLAVAGYFGLRDHKREAVPQPAIRSLAVLPLRNLSQDASQEYLADGVTEALIGRLSGIRNLRVTSHTTVMRFKNEQLSVPEIARTLGVDAVVEGSIEREGSRIRVTAQLIRGATDQHFWSETYDREFRDALSLESDLAQSIAQKVEVTVTGQEEQRLVAARPVAPEVYESYLKGISILSPSYDKKNVNEGIQDFEDAIRRDPSFAPAYIGLAAIYSDEGSVFAGNPPEETRPKVISLAKKALALDPDFADAHALLADTLQEEFRWAEAETEFKRALDLAPNDALVRNDYAMWLLCQGRTDEAIDEVRRARELDPLSVSGFEVSWILFQSHHAEEAVREARSALAVRSEAWGLTTLGFALLGNQQPGDAIPVLEKAVSVSHGSPAAEGILIRAYALGGRRADALRLLAELKRRRSAGYVPAAAFVNAYLGLGDKEQAFAWLERAYQEKSNMLQFVKTHPFFDPIRSDPRFVDLVRRVGLG